MEKEKNVKKRKTGIYLLFIFVGLICGYVVGCLFGNNGINSELCSSESDKLIEDYLLRYLGINPNDYSDIGFGYKLVEAYTSNGNHSELVSFINSYAEKNTLFEKEQYFDVNDPKCIRTTKENLDGNNGSYCYLLSQSNFDMIAKMYNFNRHFENYSFTTYAIFDNGRIINFVSSAPNTKNNNFNTYYEIYEAPVNLIEGGIFIEYKYDVISWNYNGNRITLNVSRTKKTNLGEVLETKDIYYELEKETDGKYYISNISLNVNK